MGTIHKRDHTPLYVNRLAKPVPAQVSSPCLCRMTHSAQFPDSPRRRWSQSMSMLPRRPTLADLPTRPGSSNRIRILQSIVYKLAAG
jgi:hypothetical protein